MMRKTLLLLLLFAVPLMAQTSNTGRVINGLAAAKPSCSTNPNDANAHSGDIYNDTDDQNTFKCSGGVWVTLGGGASIPFTTVAFSATPSFSGTPISIAYSMTLTGNVTSSTVTGVPTNGNVMKLHICQGAGGPWTFAFPANFLNTTTIQTTSCTDETYNFDGTNWSQITQPAGGAGGGGSSAGAQGTIQAAASAGAFQATNLSETGGVLTVNEQSSNRGPNIVVDVTAFNARAVNPNSIPLTTGTITAAQNTLTVASNSGWQKNDGLALVGGGATNCATPPVAPTGFPALASSMTGTGYSVAGATGSTSYSYAVIAVSQGGCFTAASPVLTISNGNATLGANNLPITSCANVTGTVTCTVGSTANLATGTWTRIGGTTDDLEFGGYYRITVINGTQFTFSSGISSTYGMVSTTATGGTLYYWVSNHLALPALPAGTNMFQEIVGRCIGASCALPANAANYLWVYASYPLGLFGSPDATYGTWDDYGTTMTQALTINQTIPWFIPSTPPASNVNDMLVTTVTNIAGTTFTLAANATNSTTSASVRFDNAPAIAAGVAAIAISNTGGGGTLHFPPAVENPAQATYCYVTSSYVALSVRSVTQGAPVCLGDTLELTDADWYGTREDSGRMQKPGFSFQYEMPVYDLGANPAIWRKSGAIKNVSLEMFSAGGLMVFDTSGTPQITSDVNFYSGAGANDYMGILYYYYNDQAGTGQFGGHFFRTSWTSGPNQVIGATSTPLFISKNGQQWDFDYMAGSLRGFYIEANSANTATGFSDSFKMGEEWQGPITPIFTFNNAGGVGLRGGNLYFEQLLDDSGSEPYIVNGSTGGSIGAPLFINGFKAAPQGFPYISGSPFLGGIWVFGPPFGNNQIGTNHDLTLCPQANVNTVTYTGCAFPAMNLAIATYAVSHTLNPSEGIVKETTAGTTITANSALKGQAWDVINASSGSITLAVTSGTLFCNGTTGSCTIPTNQSVRVDCDGANCSALGLGGGSPGGSTDAIQYNAGGGNFGGVNSPTANGNYLVNYNVTVGAAVAPTITIPGIPINSQTGTTYTYLYSDRGSLIRANNAGAQTYTLVNPSSAGFGSNYFGLLWNVGTGTVTDNASGFNINAGASLITPPNWSRWLYSDGVNYFALRLPDFGAFPNCTGGGNALQFTVSTGAFSCGASSAGVSSLTGDGALITNSASTGAVTLTLGTAGAHKWWGNPTASTATPGYNLLTDGDMPVDVVLRNQANTYSGGGLQDFSAMVWKVPTSAGFTASATSMSGYDSTNKNPHCYDNNADAICAGFASAPANKQVVQASVSSSNVLLTGIDFPDVKVVPAANCNNATAGPGWSIGSGGTATCRAGTNNKGGYIAITDTSTTFAQFGLELPEDWDTASNPFIRVDFGYPGTDTGHTIIPSIQVSCQKGDGTTTDDVAFNAAHSLSTTTTNATANQFWSSSNVQMNATDVTGCVAGAWMVIQIGRATDTATSAVNFYSAIVTIPRLLTVQAN